MPARPPIHAPPSTRGPLSPSPLPARGLALPWSWDNSTNSAAVFTLVLWSVCLAVGAVGFALPYERPRPPRAPEAPILTQPLQVELTQEWFAPPEMLPSPPDPLSPPPPPDALTLPAIVQPIAVAEPGPAIAFPLPVQGPTRLVDVSRADYAVPPVRSATASVESPGPVAQPLTFGQGQGRQPAPDYPATARRQGQEGTVLVRLTVGENGRVLAAEAALPSPWPLLNEAALRAVRERWSFPRGPARLYEVPIRFEIVK